MAAQARTAWLRRRRRLVFATGLALLALGCADEEEAQSDPATAPGVLDVAISGVDDGDAVPVKHTCDGEDVSPPIAWSGAPAGATEFLIAITDTDAEGDDGEFVHWLVARIGAGELRIDEGAPEDVEEGVNDFGDTGYGGPCPPEGATHTYRLEVFALDDPTDLSSGFTIADLRAADEESGVAHGEATFTYERGADDADADADGGSG